MLMRPVLIALLALTGCATVPEGDDERPVAGGVQVAESVELCRTKVDQLTARLGQPSRDGRLGTTRILTWVVAWDPLVSYLGVMVDEAGTVVDVYWNLPSEIQWSPLDRCG